MAKKFNFKETKLYREAMRLTAGNAWPFHTVDMDDFLKVSKQLLQLEHDVGTRKINKQKVSAEVYMDRTKAATKMMTRYIQKMKMEAAAQEMNSKIRVNKGQVGDMSFIKAKEFADYALDKMCDGHNRVCNALKNDLEKKNIFVSPISPETSEDSTLDEKIDFVIKTVEEHYRAMNNAYKDIESLIQYGLPADGFIIQTIDRIAGNDGIKMHNEMLVDKILNSEADLDVINTYILPEIDMKIQEYQAQAIIEAAEVKDQSELEFGELRHNDPYFFRRQYEAYVAARDAIKNALLQMKKKEKALESNYKIKIDIDPKTATYIFTASWTSGQKLIKEDSKKISENIKKMSKTTKENNSKERSIKIKIGQSSRSLYEEMRRQTACQFGYTNEREIGTKQKSIKNIFSTRLVDRKAIIQRKTRVAGKKEYETKASFDVAKVEEKMVYVEKQDWDKDKENTIAGASIGVGNISAGINANNALPIAKASANLASANINILNIAKAGASIGSIGYNSELDLIGKANEAAFEYVVGADDSSVIETIKNIAESSIQKVQNITMSGPKASAKIEVGEITILGASHNGKEGKVENRIPEIIDCVTGKTNQTIESQDSDEFKQSVDGKEEIVENMSEEMVNEAIDMRVLRVDDGAKTPILQDAKLMMHYTQDDVSHDRV